MSSLSLYSIEELRDTIIALKELMLTACNKVTRKSKPYKFSQSEKLSSLFS